LDCLGSFLSLYNQPNNSPGVKVSNGTGATIGSPATHKFETSPGGAPASPRRFVSPYSWRPLVDEVSTEITRKKWTKPDKTARMSFVGWAICWMKVVIILAVCPNFENGIPLGYIST